MGNCGSVGLRSVELARRATRLDRPEEGLRAVAALRSHLSALEEEHVRNAVLAGASWGKVAGLLGVSRQAVHKRYATRCRPPDPATNTEVPATEQARQVVRIASEEAAAMGHGTTGPEHLLLALLRDDRGAAVLALEGVDVSYSAARREVRRLYGQPENGDGPPPNQVRAPISARAREALEHAVREARSRGDATIGVEHVLLGVLRDREGGAAETLNGLGVHTEEVEERLLGVLVVP